MNMIEKVARAIQKAERSTSSLRFFYPVAKAAIEAMKEPTEEMIEAFSSTAHDEYIKRCWDKAIEAALKE